MTEAGGNPIEGMEGGEYAETLASAMAGLADMFEFITDDAAGSAGHEDVAAGYRAFNERHTRDFIDVQAHGMQLADNIQEGAGQIDINPGRRN
ncbi:hypothetical protein [Nocardiopsis aegyptia]|uniref:Uncharacterized protein n=1 Tax=Nocardiopsis aegyptia TaxID=220378 RepID=A0A7Z0EQI1_9ACTN|nr:hypothetical protein [Nocardiopsis aegyptia]NYJ35563.1 hypothetical protein [Nocardiopsis aegyptia]